MFSGVGACRSRFYGCVVFLTAVLSLGALPGSAASPSPAASPHRNLNEILSPSVFRRILNEREVMAQATLQSFNPPLKRYSFYSAMVVHASLAQTRSVLTNYELYAKMIPYVDRAEYHASSHLLHIEGGIWRFKLISNVQFEEKSDQWIRFRVVSGHFTGLTGEIFFESLGEKGTGVYFAGEQVGENWPPALILERGAEIVFEFTAKKMRSVIESQRRAEPQGAPNDQAIPQPRSHL